MPSARRRELLDVAAALVVDHRRGAKCAVELTKLLKSDGYAAPAAADAIAELAHLDDSLAAFVSLMYTSRDFACQARVASMISTLVARAGLDEGDAGRAFESVDKGGFARLVLAARRVESPVAFARDVCSFVRAFNAAKGREATGVTMMAAAMTRVIVGRARLECPAVAFNGDEGFCLVAPPGGDDPNGETPVTFAYGECVRVARLAGDGVMTCGVHRAPVGWERSVYGVDSRDDEWIKVEFSAADVPNVKRALATAAASHPSVFKGAGGRARRARRARRTRGSR